MEGDVKIAIRSRAEDALSGYVMRAVRKVRVRNGIT